MSGCHCTHSYHDEIFDFTGVERTKTEINVHLFDTEIKLMYICLKLMYICLQMFLFEKFFQSCQFVAIDLYFQ